MPETESLGGSGGSTPVALDGMGGDRAPLATVDGALKAASEGASVILTGPARRLEALVEERAAALGADLSALPGAIRVIDAPDTVSMSDEPARAVRAKPRSSIAVACSLVAEGEAGAVVSAGSTGAAVAGAVLKFGRLKGILRPGIATVIPFPAHPIVLIDSGANAECRPEHLLQFALMGSVFVKTAFGRELPRVGLLNIGEEEAKGASLHREAHARLRSVSQEDGTPFEFVGNVEGHDLPHAAADVVVTDGFTGNVVLKLAEGLARSLIQEVVGAVAARTEGEAQRAAVGALLELRSRVNADGLGGACLLGVRSLAVIAHGSSNADSVAKAVLFAGSDKASRIQTGIVEALGYRGDDGAL